jgi:hypothetical protein
MERSRGARQQRLFVTDVTHEPLRAAGNGRVAGSIAVEADQTDQLSLNSSSSLSERQLPG